MSEVNKFCRLLSNGFRLQSDGTMVTYSPCCWFTTRIDISSPTFKEERERISKIKGWTPECRACRQIEQSKVYGNQSPRINSVNTVPDDTVPNGEPVRLEITIDTKCNAACLICGPWHSTTWEKQQIKFGIKDITEVPDRINPKNTLDKFKSMYSFKYLNSVMFLGGEPFQSDIPYQFLQFIKTIKPLNDVIILFQTNGSIQPSSKLLDLLNECKLVRYSYSLDGINEQAEYLRYPLRWSKILSTLGYIKKNTNDAHTHTILATMTPLNLLRYNELEQWATEFFLDSLPPPNFSILRPNRAIGQMDLAFTPFQLRVDAARLYGAGHPVTKMLSNLDYRKDGSAFLSYLDTWDQNRRTNWRETFPEAVKYFS